MQQERYMAPDERSAFDRIHKAQWFASRERHVRGMRAMNPRMSIEEIAGRSGRSVWYVADVLGERILTKNEYP